MVNEKTPLVVATGDDDDDSSSSSKLPVSSPAESSTAPSSSSSNSNHHHHDNEAAAFSSSIRHLSTRMSEIIQTHSRKIGMLGSMAIAVNSLTGPAMLNLPACFARSGIIPTVTTLVFVCILSALCCLHMANCISKVPHNQQFDKQVEFSDAFRYFWGSDTWFLVTHVLFFCCITCLNISSIVDTSQVVDTFLGHWWPWGGGSAALLIRNGTTSWVSWSYESCTQEDLHEGHCIPFDQEAQEGILLTAGNLVVTVIFLPLALMDLKENALGQILGYLILLVTSAQFVIQFSLSDNLDTSRITWWGYDWDDLFGVVLFNFALVIAIPAWLYQREPNVQVQTVIHRSSGLAVVLYIAIGILGCLAMPNVSENMLESMMSGAFGTLLQLGASIFAFAIIGLGIPLFSVLTRLNLTGSGLCSRFMGNVLAVYVPFGVAWMLYDGTSVTKLLSWGGTIFTGLVAFILPIVLALHVTKDFDYQGSVDVYSGWIIAVGSKRREMYALIVLLVLAVGSIAVAIAGNLI